MQGERRQNDQIIIDEIRVLQKDVSGIQVNLALNTQETARLARYQETQNGRVVKLESRAQVLEGATALTTTAVAKIQSDADNDQREEEKQRDKKDTRRTSTYDKLVWIAVGLGLRVM